MGGGALRRSSRRLAGAAGARFTWSAAWREPLWGRAGTAAAIGMDLAVAAVGGAGAAPQHQQIRDEVAEKCQKLFLDFLEE